MQNRARFCIFAAERSPSIPLMTKSVLTTTLKGIRKLFPVAAVAVFTLCACSHQAPPSQPSLPAAMARIQANDFAGAVAILEQVTQREPRNGRAWRNLALCYQNLKQWDHAINANQHALQVESSIPTPLFSLGVVYALMGDKDQAFTWLAKAKATHKVDMTQLESTPELAPLKGDPRFAALLPTRADFDDPFVEPLKIIREFDGESANDQFG